MSYENPQVPHEVNVSRENVYLEFLRLAVGIALVCGLAALGLYFAGGHLARLIPFSVEQRWVGDRFLGPALGGDAGGGEAAVIEPYLQALTDKLATGMDLPDGMRPRVHFVDADLPNAFASLGGQMAVTAGLLRRMPSENALAAVLGHEIGHLRTRDPIAAAGSAASLALVLGLISGNAEGIVMHLTQAVGKGYSREVESRADVAAIAALKRHYGHAGGAAAVFEVFEAYQTETTGLLSEPWWLSSHPSHSARIARMREAAADWDPVRMPLIPIPATIANAVRH